MNHKLAIVIPAYKALFFKEAMDSIAGQSCKDFTLYVGDDASPENLKNITDQFVDRIKIIYHRYDENEGQKDLAKQWERCIGLSTGEEYIWLFSDDDIMTKNAVESFYKTIEKEREYDLYRFNIRQIDSSGLFISDSTNHPEIETAENFIYRRLKGVTLSAACEYIFSRKAYQKTGRFVHFPLGWGSDDASWYLLGKEKGIYTIQGNPVYWRVTEANISASGRNRNEKYKATFLLFRWIRQQNISERVLESIPFSLRRQSKILKVNLRMFLKSIFDVYKLIGIRETFKIIAFMMKRHFIS